MANERTYPCLPCRDIDQAIAFYEAHGFTWLAVRLDDRLLAVLSLQEAQSI